jgi:argininosuccinate synthase
LRGHAAVRRVEDLNRVLDPSAPVVTLFSGGLDGSHLLHLLAERGFSQVYALVVDLGDDLDREWISAVARRFGAKVEYRDRQAEFVEEYVFPAIRAHAVYLGLHPVSASLSRPLIAREGVDLAKEVGAQSILHTANQSQNTLRRLNGALRLLEFDGAFGSPYEQSAIARTRKQADLAAAGVDLLSRSFSSDCNLWCREFESGALDDPEGFEVPAHLFRWSVPEPAAPCRISIGFAEGRPVTLDDASIDGRELIARLNVTGGRYGLGRYVGLEHLPGGEKVLEVREMPAAAVLLTAYRQLESAVVDAETIREKLHVEQLFIREAVEGRWFGSMRAAADAFVAEVATAVTGTVVMEVSQYGAQTVAVQGRQPLYIRNREQWEAARVDAR